MLSVPLAPLSLSPRLGQRGVPGSLLDGLRSTRDPKLRPISVYGRFDSPATVLVWVDRQNSVRRSRCETVPSWYEAHGLSAPSATAGRSSTIVDRVSGS